MEKIIIASGPVIVEEGKVLLNKHGDTPFWKFCGGKVEGFEQNLIENARREAREEMGIELEILDDVPVITFTRKEKDGHNVDVILVHFLAKRSGDIRSGADIDQWAWHDLGNLPTDLAPNILPVLQAFGFLEKTR